MQLRHRLASRAETVLIRAGLVRPASWSKVLDEREVCLYAGDLPRGYLQYNRFYGITPFRAARRNVPHDLRDSIPIPANTVDIFQAEDVFEHIELESVPPLLDEIYRILKPGGLFRLSVPDYNFALYRERSLRDAEGNLIFDPGGGGWLKDGNVVGGGHLWFPTIDKIRKLLDQSKFENIEFLQYRQPSGAVFKRPVDHSIAPVRRSAELDPRGGPDPVSIIVDLRKMQPSPHPGPGNVRSYLRSGKRTLLDRMKSFGKGTLPPLLLDAVRKIKNRNREQELFWGDSELFRRHLPGAQAYGEYGCGLSTLWVCAHFDIPVMSVDTSQRWIDYVRQKLEGHEGVELQHVDLGELGDWGRPLTYARRESIRDYTEGPWRGVEKPNVVLIDGRFRVACFFASLIHARPGTVILFDDYAHRPNYHLVEEYVAPQEICGRQAAFVVPADLPGEELRSEYERFLYVMD